MKRHPTTILLSLLFFFCSSVPLLAQTGSENTNPDTVTTVGTENHKVIVYYLYFMPRCETCLNMEAYAKEAVESGFPEELRQGKVEWHSYNTDLKQYEHFWDDFKLETKSLVMVDMQGDKQVKWKICEQTWDLVNVKPTYLEYVQGEVRSYLQGAEQIQKEE